MSGSADVHKAIVSAWVNNGLNAIFKAYWDSSKMSAYEVLHDQEAGPAQPFPYCVYEIEQGRTTDKMSASDLTRPTSRNEVRSIPITFNIHTRSLTAGNTAKKVGSALLDEVLKVFGGHPSTEPATLNLDNGAALLMRYETDWAIREGDQNYVWHVRYSVIVDVPVAN